jgi:2-polyprenyl-6-methoxyphenol hydroxylase-like FAD-dependent oxidoreductase
MCILQTGAASALILSLDATGFDQAFEVPSHLKCSRVYSGYFIWRGAPNESDLSPSTRETMFPYFSFFLGDQLQALGYPISGADDELRIGHRRYNFGWYRVADAIRLQQMCTDNDGRQYEFGMPPPLVRKDLIAEMRNEAEILLPPQYVDCLRHIDQPFFTPVYDFCSPTLVFGRVALVGDAASTPRPHIGFGVAKAGAEAQALAEALSNYDNIDRALLAYNAARQTLSERIVSHSRKLGMQLGVGIENDEDRRLAALLRTPRGIMDRVAVPNFLEMRP